MLVIESTTGFGNKIIDIVTGLYFKHVNGGEIYMLLKNSVHDRPTDPKLINIFPELKEHFKIINNNDELTQLCNTFGTYIINCSDIKKIDDFIIDNENNKKKVILLAEKYKSYCLFLEMYRELPEEIKKVININKILITPKTEKIVNELNDKTAVVHVRYGDKLKTSRRKDSQFTFLICTPDFYIEMINKFIEDGFTKIFIVTDENKIVEKFIVEKITNRKDKIEILNIPFYEAFYLLSKSINTVISISSFSLIPALIGDFNGVLKNAYIATRPEDIDSVKIAEERIVDKISDIKWNKYTSKRYILNYYLKMMRTMWNTAHT